MRVRSVSARFGAVAIAAGALAAAAPALGQEVSVDGGSTLLHLDRATAGVLADAGLAVGPVGPSRASGLRVSFPVTGGSIDPATAAGVVNHSGGLRFSAGRTVVNATNFQVRTGVSRPYLTARVGGSVVALAFLDVSDAVVLRRGPGRVDTWVVRVDANLHPMAARALTAAFGAPIPAGARVGRVDMRTSAGQVALRGGATTLALDPGTAAALTSLGVAPSVIAPGTAGERGLDFPVTGGTLDVGTFAGTIPHAGGIALTAGDTRVELTDFIIEVSGSPVLTARVGDGDARVPLKLDLSDIRAGLSARTAVVRDAKVSLTAEAAAALNSAFGVPALAEDLPLGVADVRARVR